MAIDMTESKREAALTRHNENFLRTLLDNVPDLVWLKNKEGVYLFCNAMVERFFGAKTSEIIGKTDYDFFSHEQASLFHENDLIAIAQAKPHTSEQIISCAGHKSQAFLEVIKMPMYNDDGSLVGILGIARDITERKNNEIALRIAATAFESQDGMFITDANHIILRVNQAFTLITGYQPEDIVGETPLIFNAYHQDNSFYAELWDSIFAAGTWQGEIWAQRKNGEIYIAWLVVTPVKDENAHITHYVTVLSDITKRKEAEEQVKQFAFYDALTQLPNRRKLLERLEHSISVSLRSAGRFAVLMLDLDKFKVVNDRFGHLVGDELLQHVADRLCDRLRSTDMVARLGGDEFTVLLANISNKEDAARVAEVILNDLMQTFTLSQNIEVQVSTSIGISLYPEHGNTPEVLLDNADVALYQAKNNGRSCFAYFSEKLTMASKQRLQLESKLRQALVQQDFRIYYQAQLSMLTGEIVGAEALIRWQDGNRLILPSHFIPVAEETSLIIDISEWALYETCQQGQTWLEKGLPPITLSINISAQQIKRGNIVELVRVALKQTGFPAQQLELEITERGLLENQDPEAVIDILQQLHVLGVQLTIDNFGTGYSSLSHLNHFPLERLKIDRSFIQAISPHREGIASTIITIAHSLGFKVLAEGVETPEQLEFLREKGCDFYQGFLHSKAVSAAEFAALLREQTVPFI